MKSAGFKNVTVAVTDNKKKSKFNFSHDVNTTFDWGSVQPIMKMDLMPDSSVNVNMEQLTRLSPMPVPTFGRVKLKSVAHFIPIKEIFPNWEYLLSQTSINRPVGSSDFEFVPSVIPHINSSVLTAFALAGCKMNVFYSGVPSDGALYDSTWQAVLDTGTASSPASAITTSVLSLGQYLLGSYGGQALLGNVYNLTPWNYNGFCMSFWKFTTGSKTRGLAISDPGDDFCLIPTMTTKSPTPLTSSTGSVANGYTHSWANIINPATGKHDVITFDGGDLVWESEITAAKRAANSGSVWSGFATSAFDDRRIRVVFKLSSFGKRLRKILIGLGYNFSLTDDSEVSLLPLLAYYKSWWDSYAPEREKNFYQTDAWRLIQLFSDGNLQCNVTDWISDQNLGANMRLYLKRFMRDLGTCFATERVDAISAATDKVILNSNASANLSYDIVNEVLRDYDAVFGTSVHTGFMELSKEGSSGNFVPGLRQASSGVNATLQKPQLDALLKAYRYVNKRSVAGMNLAALLRMNGYGKYVEECKGLFIAAGEDSIKISDVVATAGTADSKLGQYGGRGLGVSTDKFSYGTDVHGILIMLAVVVPESGYINAPDPYNEIVQFSQLFNGDFDGMSYEAIRKKMLIGSTFVQVEGDKSCNDTFGFLPTYSRLKFTSNRANGDFSLNSMKSSLRSYTLDKYLPVNDISVRTSEINTSGSVPVMVIQTTEPFSYANLPNAGEDYRYINKQPWCGDYNRIFSAEDDGIEWQYVSSNDDGYLYNSFEFDNFLTHFVFEIAYQAPMKAIEDSYSTFDPDDGQATGGVARS